MNATDTETTFQRLTWVWPVLFGYSHFESSIKKMTTLNDPQHATVFKLALQLSTLWLCKYSSCLSKKDSTASDFEKWILLSNSRNHIRYRCVLPFFTTLTNMNNHSWIGTGRNLTCSCKTKVRPYLLTIERVRIEEVTYVFFIGKPRRAFLLNADTHIEYNRHKIISVQYEILGKKNLPRHSQQLQNLPKRETSSRWAITQIQVTRPCQRLHTDIVN